jgi:hypothetical protein
MISLLPRKKSNSAIFSIFQLSIQSMLLFSTSYSYGGDLSADLM